MAIIVAHATLRDLVMVPPIFGSSDLIAVTPEPVGDDVDEILNGPHVGEVARLQVQPVVLECAIGDGEKARRAAAPPLMQSPMGFFRSTG